MVVPVPQPTAKASATGKDGGPAGKTETARSPARAGQARRYHRQGKDGWTREGAAARAQSPSGRVARAAAKVTRVRGQAQLANTPSRQRPARSRAGRPRRGHACQAAPRRRRRPPPASMDNKVADALRDTITGKRLDRYVHRKDDREGVKEFYNKRGYKPIWTQDGKADARAKETIAFLAQVDADGLGAERLSDAGFPTATTPEVWRSRTASDRCGAEIRPRRADRPHPFQPRRRRHLIQAGSAGAGQSAGQGRRATDVAETLDGYNPPQTGFQALKAKLAELRANGGQIARPAEQSAAGARAGRAHPAPRHEGRARDRCCASGST